MLGRDSLILCILSCLLFKLCQGDCVAEPPSFQEEFERVDNVVRLRSANSCQTTPCYYKVYEANRGYINSNIFFEYEVIEVFKGDAVTTGERTPVAFSTDTGIWRRIPKTQDFLAFLIPIGPGNRCPPESPALITIDECTQHNKEWSKLTQEELEFLNASDIPPVEDPMTVTCPVTDTCNCRWYQFMCLIFCLLERILGILGLPL